MVLRCDATPVDYGDAFHHWMFLRLDAAGICKKVFPHAEQKLRTSCRAVRDNSVQCEIEYEEMSHMNYQLQLERDDKQRLIDSYNREIETLESYGQVMKDTSDANKENAAKSLSELKDVKERLQEENKPCLTQ